MDAGFERQAAQPAQFRVVRLAMDPGETVPVVPCVAHDDAAGVSVEQGIQAGNEPVAEAARDLLVDDDRVALVEGAAQMGEQRLVRGGASFVEEAEVEARLLGITEEPFPVRDGVESFGLNDQARGVDPEGRELPEQLAAEQIVAHGADGPDRRRTQRCEVGDHVGRASQRVVVTRDGLGPQAGFRRHLAAAGVQPPVGVQAEVAVDRDGDTRDGPEHRLQPRERQRIGLNGVR